MRIRLCDLQKAFLSGIILNGIVSSAQTAPYQNATSSLASHGNGTSYASACSSARLSWTSASLRFDSEHMSTVTSTYTNNGLGIESNVYYEGATTLCDGHARVSYSPAIALSTGPTYWISTAAPSTTTETDIQGSGIFSVLEPSCSIQPADCDALYQEYHSAKAAPTPQITPPPQRPPCVNSTQASSNAAFDKSFYGCGPCTIFGDDVQLVYFPVPTTVSRDMCATTPSASLTHYASKAVITAYAGTAYSGMNDSKPGQETALVDGHTFTSGTAYISIASVWAEDRCFSRKGTTVRNAILAMPSESVLSLRYTQDHFQYFSETAIQTGFPVNYADFNEPVPYSAWNGQDGCDPYGRDWSCNVIYDGQYRPQLAIPPAIKQLSPEWAGCQVYFRGLYDPPLALTPASSAAGYTLPIEPGVPNTALPSPVAAVPTADPTGRVYQLPGSRPLTNQAWTPHVSGAAAAAGVGSPNAQSANEGTGPYPGGPHIAVPGGQIEGASGSSNTMEPGQHEGGSNNGPPNGSEAHGGSSIYGSYGDSGQNEGGSTHGSNDGSGQHGGGSIHGSYGEVGHHGGSTPGSYNGLGSGNSHADGFQSIGIETGAGALAGPSGGANIGAYIHSGFGSWATAVQGSIESTTADAGSLSPTGNSGADETPNADAHHGDGSVAKTHSQLDNLGVNTAAGGPTLLQGPGSAGTPIAGEADTGSSIRITSTSPVTGAETSANAGVASDSRVSAGSSGSHLRAASTGSSGIGVQGTSDSSKNFDTILSMTMIMILTVVIAVL